MFRKADYLLDCPHSHEVHFAEKPDDTLIRQLIDRYFGGQEVCFYSHFGSQKDNPHHSWRFELMGEVDGGQHSGRCIEGHLDRDTHCGARREPFYFLIRNEAGDDAYTLAVAVGLAEFIAKETGGQLIKRE